MGHGIKNLLRASLHMVLSNVSMSVVVPNVGCHESSGCKSALQGLAHGDSTAQSPLLSQAEEKG